MVRRPGRAARARRARRSRTGSGRSGACRPRSRPSAARRRGAGPASRRARRAPCRNAGGWPVPRPKPIVSVTCTRTAASARGQRRRSCGGQLYRGENSGAPGLGGVCSLRGQATARVRRRGRPARRWCSARRGRGGRRARTCPRAVVAKLRLGAVHRRRRTSARAADAARARARAVPGRGEEHERDNGVSLLVLPRRRDGLLVGAAALGRERSCSPRATGQSLEATTGVGFELGPVHVGGSVSGGGAFRLGPVVDAERGAAARAAGVHEAATPASARLLLEGLLGEPDETFLEGGGVGSAQLAAEAMRSVPGAGARRARGARAAQGPRRDDLLPRPRRRQLRPDHRRGARPGRHRACGGRVPRSDPPVSPCAARRRGHGGEETETVLRLPLRDAADRAAARRVAFLDLRRPGAARCAISSRACARAAPSSACATGPGRTGTRGPTAASSASSSASTTPTRARAASSSTPRCSTTGLPGPPRGLPQRQRTRFLRTEQFLSARRGWPALRRALERPAGDLGLAQVADGADGDRPAVAPGPS